MAISTDTSDTEFAVRGRRRRRRSKPMSEINVTPFVDVMLVLLIVFMVTAPLLSAGVPINLPQAPSNPLATEKEPVTVTVDAEGRIFIGEDEVTVAEVAQRLISMVNGLDDRIYMRGDQEANYGAIMTVMGTLSAAGFSNLAMVTLPPQEES